MSRTAAGATAARLGILAFRSGRQADTEVTFALTASRRLDADNVSRSGSPDVNDGERSPLAVHSYVHLADGRRLSHTEWGDPVGSRSSNSVACPALGPATRSTRPRWPVRGCAALPSTVPAWDSLTHNPATCCWTGPRMSAYWPTPWDCDRSRCWGWKAVTVYSPPMTGNWQGPPRPCWAGPATKSHGIQGRQATAGIAASGILVIRWSRVRAHPAPQFTPHQQPEPTMPEKDGVEHSTLNRGLFDTL